MTANPCIPQSDLARFVRGALEPVRLGQIASHVDGCDSCQDTVVALADNDDTFVSVLREVHAETPFEREAALRQGLRRMVQSIQGSVVLHLSDRTAPLVNQVGPYLIDSQLGTGGMGTVYRAVHSKLKRTVALKLLPAARWSNATAISRFEREMEAIGGLDHPHIVRASDAGEDQGMHYLVMDYVEGLDLSRLVSRLGPLPVADACELARQTALGLQYVHENGLVHRDVKPSNLMLAWGRVGASDGQASLQILDLGLALLGDEHLQATGGLTSVGQLMGTLDYMSPEQGIDSHSVDHRTDIYGLGATLFKLLTGRAPYADPRFGTLMKKMTALATKSAPSVGDIRKDLPAKVVSLVDRMLARDPDARFDSANEVAAALEPLASEADLPNLLTRGLEASEKEESPVVILPASQLVATDSQNSDDPHTSEASQSSKKTPRTGRLWNVVACVVGLATAGSLFYVSTDYGNILIETEAPSAEVVIKKGEDVIESLQIKQNKGKTRIRAGEYSIELAGDSAGFEINPRQVDVKRGEVVTVNIGKRSGLFEIQDDMSPASDSAKSELPHLSSDIQERHSQLVSAVANQRLELELVKKRLGAKHPKVDEISTRIEVLQRFLDQTAEEISKRAVREQQFVEESERKRHARFQEAQAMFQDGDIRGALQRCTNETKPGSFPNAAWYALQGECFRAEGEVELAIRALTKATTYSDCPNSANVTLAQIYADLGEPNKAAGHYELALKGDPFDETLLFERAKTQETLGAMPVHGGQHTAKALRIAVKSYERLLKHHPHSRYAPAAHENLALIHANNRELKQVLKQGDIASEWAQDGKHVPMNLVQSLVAAQMRPWTYPEEFGVTLLKFHQAMASKGYWLTNFDDAHAEMKKLFESRAISPTEQEASDWFAALDEIKTAIDKGELPKQRVLVGFEHQITSPSDGPLVRVTGPETASVGDQITFIVHLSNPRKTESVRTRIRYEYNDGLRLISGLTHDQGGPSNEYTLHAGEQGVELPLIFEADAPGEQSVKFTVMSSIGEILQKSVVAVSVGSSMAREIQKAQSAYDSENLAEAIRLCDAILKKKGNGPAYILKAKCFAKLGESDLAGRSLAKAVSKLPKTAESYKQLAEVGLNIGRISDAKRWSDDAVEIAPFDVEALFIRGRAYLNSQTRSQDHRVALHSLRRVVELDPSHVGAHHLLIDGLLMTELSNSLEFQALQYEEALGEIATRWKDSIDLSRQDGSDVDTGKDAIALYERMFASVRTDFERVSNINGDESGNNISKLLAERKRLENEYGKEHPLIDRISILIETRRDVGKETTAHLENALADVEKQLKVARTEHPDDHPGVQRLVKLRAAIRERIQESVKITGGAVPAAPPVASPDNASRNAVRP